MVFKIKYSYVMFHPNFYIHEYAHIEVEVSSSAKGGSM